MKTRLFHQSLAVSLLALGMGLAGMANAQVCSVTDAIITTENPDRVADECFVFTNTTNPASETNVINQEWDPLGDDPFSFVGKTEFNDAGGVTQTTTVPGWTWTVTKLQDSVTIGGVEYFFAFTLSGGVERVGSVVDFVLGLKDGAGSADGGFAAYLWEGVTLDIGGNFSSWFNDPFQVSHASAFVRGVSVPEPATIALFGAGLLGLAWIRRRLTI